MATMGAFEAKTHFSFLLEKVARGEEVIITKHGHPIAKVIPLGGCSREEMKQAIERLKVFRKGNTLGDLNWKALRDEGRR